MRKPNLFSILIILLYACNNSDDSNNFSACGEDTFVIETNNISGDTEIIPFSTITPNGDGINDRFVIGGLAAFPNNSIRIFFNDILVFESNEYHLDQTFGSDLLNDSFDQRVFTYELSIDNGDTFRARGTICAVLSSNSDIDSCNTFGLFDPLLLDCN